MVLMYLRFVYSCLGKSSTRMGDLLGSPHVVASAGRNLHMMLFSKELLCILVHWVLYRFDCIWYLVTLSLQAISWRWNSFSIKYRALKLVKLFEVVWCCEIILKNAWSYAVDVLLINLSMFSFSSLRSTAQLSWTGFHRVHTLIKR